MWKPTGYLFTSSGRERERETIVANAKDSETMAERSQEVQLRILKDRNLAFLHSVYSGNVKEAFDLLENDELIQVDFTTSDGESALHLACRNQLLHLTQVLIEKGWNFGLYCKYKNTRPYSELNPFDENSTIVKYQRRAAETSADTANKKKPSDILPATGSTDNESKRESYAHKMDTPGTSKIVEVFRNVQGPISYIVLVFSKDAPAFVVGDSIGAPKDRRRKLYMKTINTMYGLSFERYDNAPYENNLLDIEFVCHKKSSNILVFKCMRYCGTYRFSYKGIAVHLVEDKGDNLPTPRNLRVKAITATTITLEWDPSLPKEVTPHKYRICSSNAAPSVTVVGSSTTTTLSDLSPDTTYEITIAAERYGHDTLPSKVLLATTAIAPVRPATMYENQLFYFSCEDGNIQDVKYRLETCRHETHYDRHFVHDEAKGETAIHGAAKFGHGHICKYLLSKGWKLQRFPCVLKEDDHGVVDPHIEDKLSPKKR